MRGDRPPPPVSTADSNPSSRLPLDHSSSNSADVGREEVCAPLSASLVVVGETLTDCTLCHKITVFRSDNCMPTFKTVQDIYTLSENCTELLLLQTHCFLRICSLAQ